MNKMNCSYCNTKDIEDSYKCENCHKIICYRCTNGTYEDTQTADKCKNCNGA